MVSTRKTAKIYPGDLECQKLKEFFLKRKLNLKIQTTTKKLEDPLLWLIYLALYIFTFFLLISLFIERVSHKDFDPPEYLPIDIGCDHLLLEAIQRSRYKPLKPTKPKKSIKSPTKKLNIPSLLLSFVKKSKFNKIPDEEYEDLVFEKGFKN